MPRSKEGKKRTPVDEVSLKKAIEAVKSNDPEKKCPIGRQQRCMV